ncbi:glycoside hydrolase family 30 beta sandwich domain-containing protein, partial [Oenococcus oeni]
IQTESECGFGENSWEYAEYIFRLFNHYFTAGATAYTYWNIILADSISTWGWQQNSLFSIDSKDNNKVTRNPEYYVMRHYSHYVKPGARVLESTGHFNSMGIAFRNPDDQIVVVVQNALERELPFTFVDPN